MSAVATFVLAFFGTVTVLVAVTALCRLAREAEKQTLLLRAIARDTEEGRQ